ncbi:uncharacterized protein LOC113076649 isoform X2 [Carassius auratus]|uniref:Uncharacterized protein LOC113076649 isoform X2 n=2 Tax=Carassius auratus TaxID=7957 RepID=A0A6P6N9E3_CARAU|nr:uncharacterized protein LOC113076649 isoform X2 [Carassius auratus]
MDKMFHIVVFDKTNEVEVVPSVWIKNGECMWPPNKIDITKAVKSQESPGDDWKPHKARIIFTSHDYKEARRKLPLAVDHTDIDQTDGGDSPITFQRKRIPKNILFPGEDDDDDNAMEEHLKEPKSRKGRRYSIPDAPKIARHANKLDPGKPNCPKIFHSTLALHNDEMEGIKATKSKKKRYALPNAPVISREQTSPAVDNLHLSGQGRTDLHSRDHSSPDVSLHGQSSPHLRPHGQKSPNLLPSCYSPDLYADCHSTPEIHSSQQTSIAMLSSGWNFLSESCTLSKSSTETLLSQANVEVRRPAHKSKEIHKKKHSEPSTLPQPHQTTDIEQTSSHQIFLLRNILTKQEMLMDQMRIIMKTLQCMQSSQETEIGLDRNLLPLKDLTSLQSMEGNLRSTPDLHKQLVNTLALKGGADVQESVWRIMHGLFTNSLARKVNMRGLNGKISFLRLQIRDVVIAAVRRNRLTSDATEKDIDSTVKRWLYLAPDRDGGRKERMKSKVLKDNMTG